MLNYRANVTMRTASGERYPIEGYGNLPLTVRSSSGDIPLLLRVVADKGHLYAGNQDGVTVSFSTGETLFFPSVGRLIFLYAFRPGMLVDKKPNATIVPGSMLSNRDAHVNINELHVAMPVHTRKRCARRKIRKALPKTK